jgi:hypothetical protein
MCSALPGRTHRAGTESAREGGVVTKKLGYVRQGSRRTCLDCRREFKCDPNARRSCCLDCGRKQERRRHHVYALVRMAVQSGILPVVTTLRCADCGVPATEYDHRDFTKPLKVDPVCHPCNIKRGRGYWPKPKPRLLRALAAQRPAP